MASATSRFGDEFRTRIAGDFCVYCGESPNSTEHFPPATYCKSGLLLPACKECNFLAGTSYPTEFKLRAEHVKSRLRQKYRRLWEMPYWEKNEVRALGYNLRVGVVKANEDRRRLDRRLAWEPLAYLATIADEYLLNDWIYVPLPIIEKQKLRKKKKAPPKENKTMSFMEVTRLMVEADRRVNPERPPTSPPQRLDPFNHFAIVRTKMKLAPTTKMKQLSLDL